MLSVGFITHVIPEIITIAVWHSSRMCCKRFTITSCKICKKRHLFFFHRNLTKKVDTKKVMNSQLNILLWSAQCMSAECRRCWVQNQRTFTIKQGQLLIFWRWCSGSMPGSQTRGHGFESHEIKRSRPSFKYISPPEGKSEAQFILTWTRVGYVANVGLALFCTSGRVQKLLSGHIFTEINNLFSYGI